MKCFQLLAVLLVFTPAIGRLGNLHIRRNGKCSSFKKNACARSAFCNWYQGTDALGFCFEKYVSETKLQAERNIECTDVNKNKQKSDADLYYAYMGFIRENTGGRKWRSLDRLRDPFDPKCLNASSEDDDAAEICDSTIDSDGASCVFCSAAGVFSLCLSHAQAEAASQYLDCDLFDVKEA